MPGARGRDGRLRVPRRGHSSGLRRHARLSDPAHSGAPRTGGDAHGRRIRARQRARRRRHRDVGAGRDQHGHRHRDRDDGLVAHRLHHRAGRQPPHRFRRLPGNRHHRHHAADHQAQLPGDARRRRRQDGARGLRRRRLGTPGPGAHRHHQGRAAGICRIRVREDAGAERPARWRAARHDRRLRPPRGARAHQQCSSPGHPRRARHHALGRDAVRARARGARRDPRRHDAPRHRRLSRRRIPSTSA